MKKLMIIFGAVLILMGGIVSVLKWMKIGPFQDEIIEAVVEKEPEAKSIFIDMEPILIPVFQGNQVAAKIQIQIKLETKEKEKAIKIQRLMPKISDIFISDLHAFMPRLIKQQERVDVIILKKRLKVIAERKLEKGLIDDILVQSILDTPAN